MDCGDFVKIGVSFDVECRRGQIPYKINQYYCTEPFSGALRAEKMAHRHFDAVRRKDLKGTEYFDVDFESACKYIKEVIGMQFCLNAQKTFVRIFSMLSNESKTMAIAYLSALRDKEVADMSRSMQEA